MSGVVLSQAAQDVLAERRRQVEAEGFSQASDDRYRHGDLTRAAMNYVGAACIAMTLGGDRFDENLGPPLTDISHTFGWPWARSWWKPGLVRRMLVKAGALIIAEIERLDRSHRAETGT